MFSTKWTWPFLTNASTTSSSSTNGSGIELKKEEQIPLTQSPNDNPALAFYDSLVDTNMSGSTNSSKSHDNSKGVRIQNPVALLSIQNDSDGHNGKNVFPPILASPTGDTLDTFDTFDINDAQFEIEHGQHGTSGSNTNPTTLPPLDDTKSKNNNNNNNTKTQKWRPYKLHDHHWEAVLYISISAILGSIVRAYIERIFGEDCEKANVEYVVDFLTPWTKRICVTNGGRTDQTGGALFYDLPANMVGCLIMGLITPQSRSTISPSQQSRPSSTPTPSQPQPQPPSRLPWLHSSHPLQHDDVFHASLGTGFCGCLTTFASWNTQMVVMLDGSHTVLGPTQFFTVLFGYTIGLLCAVMSFIVGRQLGLCLHLWRHPEEVATWVAMGAVDESKDDIDSNDDDDDDDEERQQQGLIGSTQETDQGEVGHVHRNETDPSVEVVADDPQPTQQEESPQQDDLSHLVEDETQEIATHLHKLPLIVLVAGLLIAFGVAGIDQNIEWYKGMMLLWITSPLGALARWKLADWNIRSNQTALLGGGGKSGGYYLVRHLPDWVPWGTLTANLSAAVIGCVVTGLEDRYYSVMDPWLRGSLFAINTGLSGSMSTVSTMIKETVILSERPVGLGKPYYYSMGTCLAGMLLGLCVYSTTVRA